MPQSPSELSRTDFSPTNQSIRLILGVNFKCKLTGDFKASQACRGGAEVFGTTFVFVLFFVFCFCFCVFVFVLTRSLVKLELHDFEGWHIVFMEKNGGGRGKGRP